jgi:hypothetical protein
MNRIKAKISLIFLVLIFKNPLNANHSFDFYPTDKYGNPDLLKKGYIRIYFSEFDTQKYDSDEHKHSYSKEGVSIYVLESEVKDGGSPNTLVYEVTSDQTKTFFADNTSVGSLEMTQGQSEMNVKGAKNMFTKVKTGTGVFSFYDQMVSTDCLKMFIYPSSIEYAPVTKIDGNLLYLTIHKEENKNMKTVNSVERRGHHGDKDEESYHDEKDDYDHDEYDFENYEEIKPLNNEIFDSGVSQYIFFFCPFWKSETENSFEYDLKLKMMSDLPYYYSKIKFFF